MLVSLHKVRGPHTARAASAASDVRLPRRDEERVHQSLEGLTVSKLMLRQRMHRVEGGIGPKQKRGHRAGAHIQRRRQNEDCADQERGASASRTIICV